MLNKKYFYIFKLKSQNKNTGVFSSPCVFIFTDFLIDLLKCSGGGFAEIPLSSRKAVCYGVVNLSPHSIAKLPGDRKYAIASAVSNEITIVDCTQYPFSPLKQPKRTYRLWDAHGVEWDAKRGCLWALGRDRIVKYALHPEMFELDTSV